VIGKTLVEKAGVPIQLLVTDRRPVLDLRLRVETPVVWIAESPASEESGCFQPAVDGKPALYRHPSIPADDASIQRLLQQLENSFDLAEPFSRVREAMNEARKMGVTNRG
jgi:hypothetical protein